jgi:hypothetical protein
MRKKAAKQRDTAVPGVPNVGGAFGTEPSGRPAERGRISIKPIRQKTYRLNDLLKRLNPKNSHEAIDLGPPQGKEVW